MRTLVLDIGGVFYRGWPGEDFWPKWTASTGLTKSAMEEFLSHAPEARDARVGRISAGDYYSKAAARLDVPAASLRALAEDAYLSDFNAGFATYVRGLRSAGVPVSALTNSLSSEADLKARPQLVGLFDHVISSCDVGLSKPDPAIFLALVERLRIEPTSIVFVDDALAHIEAARALHFEAVHFRDTRQAVAELSAYFPAASWSSRR